MKLPAQFENENSENIFIYHYVEEMVFNFRKYIDEIFENDEITPTEFPFLVRIHYKEKTTQKELVKSFKVSEGYTAKLLRKFEDKGFIKRMENPDNRRQKIVELTPKGIKKVDDLSSIINNWETQVTQNMSDEEVRTLKNLLFKVVSD